MTPKEQYEINKARRKVEREAAEVLDDRHTIRELASEELMDRFITAVERIADVLERKP